MAFLGRLGGRSAKKGHGGVEPGADRTETMGPCLRPVLQRAMEVSSSVSGRLASPRLPPWDPIGTLHPWNTGSEILGLSFGASTLRAPVAPNPSFPSPAGHDGHPHG